MREAGPFHPRRLEEARQIVHKAALLLRPFHSHVVVVDAGDGDHVDTACEKIGNDALVKEIARRLHHYLDAAAPGILCGETLDDLVRDLGA